MAGDAAKGDELREFLTLHATNLTNVGEQLHGFAWSLDDPARAEILNVADQIKTIGAAIRSQVGNPVLDTTTLGPLAELSARCAMKLSTVAAWLTGYVSEKILDDQLPHLVALAANLVGQAAQLAEHAVAHGASPAAIAVALAAPVILAGLSSDRITNAIAYVGVAGSAGGAFGATVDVTDGQDKLVADVTFTPGPAQTTVAQAGELTLEAVPNSSRVGEPPDPEVEPQPLIRTTGHPGGVAPTEEPFPPTQGFGVPPVEPTYGEEGRTYGEV